MLTENRIKKSKTDLFQSHDHYQVDELLSEEHILAREAIRQWVKSEVTPIIEDYAERAECPSHLFRQLGEIGAYGPSLPTEYGVALP